MQQATDILARGLSAVLFPLLTPTYLITAFCALFSGLLMPLPFWYWAIAIGGTAFFTLLVPMLVLLMLKHAGKVQDLDVSDRKERLIPFLYTLLSVCFWCAFLKTIHVPSFLFWTAVASTLALAVAMLITLRWKISAHLTSMGGVVGMVAGMMLYFGISSPVTISALLITALLLSYARIYLGAHTQAQTVAGFMLGLVFTLTPNIILLYV